MTNRIAVIARYTVLEAVRTRVPILALTVTGILWAASFFVREIAITESVRFQTVFYAAAMRYACVIMMALYAIASIAREFQDKNLDVILALDLRRSHYILGKLSGFVSIGTVLALLVGIPLVPLAGVLPTTQWSVSLAFELALVGALSLFCVITFSQLMPAFSFVLSFYLLARAITALRLISNNPIADASALSHRVLTGLINALALVTPALDNWTRTSWLVDRLAGWTELLGIGGHSILFIAIFASAAMFDMQRRNF